MGNPAGWLIPKVKAVLTNSGESWWKMVGAIVARYNHQAKKIKKKLSGCYGKFSYREKLKVEKKPSQPDAGKGGLILPT